jgi:hypothetical protein
LTEPRVLIVGGTGHFGQLLAQDLKRYADCEVVLTSRYPVKSPRFPTVVANLHDVTSVEQALRGAAVAICAAGPFQTLPTTLAELCMSRRIHYIDLADDRGFVSKVRSLAARHDQLSSAVCTAWSTVSALSSLLARIASNGLTEVQSVYIHMAPGNRLPRRKATIAALMSSIGQPLHIFRNGQWHAVSGWSEPRDFPFPAPIGTQRGYLIDVPDHQLLPSVLSARTVEFRVGSELGILNHTMRVLAWAVKKHIVRGWFCWSGLFQRAEALFGFFGHNWGAVGAEIAGRREGKRIARRVSIVAETGGQRLAVMPASIMTSMLLAGGSTLRGLVSPTDWINSDALQIECGKRGFRLVMEEI